jgi:hypothetical protein
MIGLANGSQEEPNGCGGGRQLSRNGTSRVNREAYARFCERLGGAIPGADSAAVSNDRPYRDRYVEPAFLPATATFQSPPSNFHAWVWPPSQGDSCPMPLSFPGNSANRPTPCDLSSLGCVAPGLDLVASMPVSTLGGAIGCGAAPPPTTQSAAALRPAVRGSEVLADSPGQSRTNQRLQSLGAGLPDALGAAEVLQQFAQRLGPDAWDLLQLRAEPL